MVVVGSSGSVCGDVVMVFFFIVVVVVGDGEGGFCWWCGGW